MKRSIRTVIVCLLCFALTVGWVLPAVATEQEAVSCADPDAAAIVLREQMEARQQVISVTFPWESADEQLITAVLDKALAHTGVPTQGDYLRWNVQKGFADISALEQDGQYTVTLTYTFTYYTTAEQEARMDAVVAQLLEQLDVFAADDYEKVCAIYDYICETVTYDNWGTLNGDPLIYSAYAALVVKSAVCQGYATLFYRLALELGLDVRVIPGTSKNRSHGWNIVRLGGKYYNLDTTWDAQNAQSGKAYGYFLRCDANFPDHTRKSTYDTEAFRELYRMSGEDYADGQKLPTGDLDGDGQVNENDAIWLLRYVLMPAFFPVDQAVDYTGDGRIDEGDAIYLLRHVLLPGNYPL